MLEVTTVRDQWVAVPGAFKILSLHRSLLLEGEVEGGSSLPRYFGGFFRVPAQYPQLVNIIFLSHLSLQIMIIYAFCQRHISKLPVVRLPCRLFWFRSSPALTKLYHFISQILKHDVVVQSGPDWVRKNRSGLFVKSLPISQVQLMTLSWLPNKSSCVYRSSFCQTHIIQPSRSESTKKW